MSEIINMGDDYLKWIKDISIRFKRSQIKAASRVNVEMLRFNFELGYDIYKNQEKNKYGTGFFKKLSLDLQKEMPDVHSFSVTNLKYMMYFYELYGLDKNYPQVGDISFKVNHPQLEDNLDEMIFMIPWGHQKLIIDKSKDNLQKALFFVRKTLENNWSRAVLMNFLDTNLYEREGKAITNFEKVLPDIGSDLAREITKDPYNFDFLTLRSNYDERELKDALMDNIQKFLLELGKGFAFVGREYRLEVGRTEQFIDMLFYNIQKHCYVVIEIKTREFESGDMGQLSTYIAAVDGILKGKDDSTTIGLLICKTKDNILAQYATSALNVPVGISEYELNNLMPEDYKNSMPTIEEIEQELKG